MRCADLDLLRTGNGLGGGVLTSEGVFRIMMQGSQGMVHTRKGVGRRWALYSSLGRVASYGNIHLRFGGGAHFWREGGYSQDPSDKSSET